VKVARPLVEVLEKEWDASVFGAKGLAPLLGWTSYHTLRSRGSRPGFPDRTLFKQRIIYAELKRELTGAKSEDLNRRPSAEQTKWLDGLSRAGGEVYLWRPSDLDEIARILSAPWTFLPLRPDVSPSLVRGGERWCPRSLWIPGVGRLEAV